MFGSTSNLNRHILTHTNIDWKCDCCDYICLTKETLLRHENEVCLRRGPQEVAKCDICEKTLATKRLLVGHKKELHSGKPKIECKLCQLEFSRKQNINSHMAKKHNERQ